MIKFTHSLDWTTKAETVLYTDISIQHKCIYAEVTIAKRLLILVKDGFDAAFRL